MARLVTNFKKSFGPGGKSSNSGLTVAVFGGHGFLGRYLLNDLGLSGTRVYLPYRGDEFEVRHVKPMFDLGQFAAVPFHPRDKESIREAVKNADIVVNYIGKYYETKHIVATKRADGKKSRVNYSFDEVHSQIAATIASVAKEAGVSRFIHISAMSANPDSLSEWSRSKARGEAAVRQVFPEAVIVRPATVFGAEDRFLNWIAEGISKLPFFPLINSGSTLIQPVYVRDVARGVLEIISNFEQYKGKTFEFAGPAEYSHKEIAEFVKDVIMYKKPLVDVSPWAATAAGRVIQELISPVLTADMVNQMLEDNVLKKKEDVLTLEDLKITPSSMDRYAFDYLHRFRRGGHFTLAKGYH